MTTVTHSPNRPAKGHSRSRILAGTLLVTACLLREQKPGRPYTSIHRFRRRMPSWATLRLWTRMNLHTYLQAAGRVDEALEQLKKVLELDENLVLAQVSMAMIHADKGNMADALKIARRAYAIGPWSPDRIDV